MQHHRKVLDRRRHHIGIDIDIELECQMSVYIILLSDRFEKAGIGPPFYFMDIKVHLPWISLFQPYINYVATDRSI